MMMCYYLLQLNSVTCHICSDTWITLEIVTFGLTWCPYKRLAQKATIHKIMQPHDGQLTLLVGNSTSAEDLQTYKGCFGPFQKHSKMICLTVPV